jgi:hypothetical protein
MAAGATVLSQSSRWDAYVTAELRIDTPGGPVHVYPAPALQATGRYPDPQRRPIAVITAHNPGGADADPAANVAAQQALEAELDRRGLTWWRAAGADPDWGHVEDSVAVPGMSEQDARKLGAGFGQEAIFLLSPAGLKVIDCLTGRLSMTGWHIEPDDGEPGNEHGAGNSADADGLGIEVTVHSSPGPVPGIPGVVLAESRWADAAGGEFLLRIADGYAIYQTNGHETEMDEIDSGSDAAAIAAFREFLGVPG